MAEGGTQAFILRITPSGNDRVPVALEDNQIIIGWAYAEGLLDPTLDWVRIPMMPISHSSGSRSVIPIDPDRCGVA